MLVINKRWLGLLTASRGSVFGLIWLRLGFTFSFAVAVTYLHHEHGFLKHTLTALPFSLIGLALGVFLGFRNNTSYDRFWEGRKLWGRFVNASRTLTRQILSLISTGGADEQSPSAEQRELVYRLIAYIHTVRHHLRDEPLGDEVKELLAADEVSALESQNNRPAALLQSLGDAFAAAYRAGRINALHLPVLDASLTELTGVQGGCERIKSTPIPFSYTVLIHRIVAFYCVGLPCGIVDTVGLATPLVVLMVAYAFFGLDAIGDEIEEPFGYDPNDLPLTSLSTMIELNLRQRLGETGLADLPKPVNGRLI